MWVAINKKSYWDTADGAWLWMKEFLPCLCIFSMSTVTMFWNAKSVLDNMLNTSMDSLFESLQQTYKEAITIITLALYKWRKWCLECFNYPRCNSCSAWAAVVRPGNMTHGAQALNHRAPRPPYWTWKPRFLSTCWDITVLLTFHLLTNHLSRLSLVAKEVKTNFQCFLGKGHLAYWQMA